MTDSSDKGNVLTNVFTKGRRDKKPEKLASAADSIKSASTGTTTTTISGGISPRRGSNESLGGKIKGQEVGGVANGLKKLVPSAIGAKRRQKRVDEEAQRLADEEVVRGRRVADRGVLHDDDDKTPVHFLREESGDSSLLTDESEDDVPAATRPTPPPLLSHPSHAGYLTTSSPLIQSTTVPTELPGLEDQLDGVATPRSSSFSEQAINLAASDVAPALLSSSLRAPADGSHKRSPSPGRRLKEAFRPARRATSPAQSPERQVADGGAEQLRKDTSAADNRRGSVASRLGSIFPEKNQAASPTTSPERPRTAKPLPIDTKPAPPQTPPPAPPGSADHAPIIVNTPPTPTDPGSPRFVNITNRDRGSSDPSAANSNPNVITSQSGNMISHRRIRSGSATLGPSKLSNITSAPLTPTPENGSSTPNPQGGFFSSVFSAAQNAANTLSNSIQNTSVVPKSKGATTIQELQDPESPVVEALGDKDPPEYTEEKELAVKTLGMGDLSLSQLGILETTSGTNTPIGTKFPEESRGRPELTKDDAAAARSSTPISGALGENFDFSPTPEAEDVQSGVKTRSYYEPSTTGEQTPPNGSVFEDKIGVQRSSSIRSALGSRRKRGSSAATGATSTIGAMITAAHSSVAHPSAMGSTPKITGFAVASKKRNRDFHQLFRSVPEDNYLIEDYSCALQREILAHGRLYVSEGHLCFSSNIFGWVTTLVMSFDEIVSLEKRNTALLFKNGLEISTLHAKHVFASFTSRDATYDLIVGIWKLGHPTLRSSLNGVRIDEAGGGDKTEKLDVNEFHEPHSGSESGSEDDGDEEFDEDTGSDVASPAKRNGSVASSEVVDKVVTRKPSAALVPSSTVSEKKESAPASTAGAEFPGPATHAATNCSDGDTHYAKVLSDEVIQAPLGQIFSLLFGPASTVWMANWLTVEQKCWELTMDGENSKKPLSSDNKVRIYSYIKPLSGSIVKQTKCICTETLDALDLEKAVSVSISTQNPDVPSGSLFSVKTKYCLSWAEGNATRIQINCAIEWTGKSWLKGTIEKGANDGQTKYAKDILASLEAAVSSKRPAAATSGKRGKKGKKSKGATSLSTQMDGTSESKPEDINWGLFEPLRPILGPLFDILKPLTTGNMMYGLLVGLLVASWFGFGLRGSNVDVGGWGMNTPERIAAYEEIWRREESDLWDWLEDRVGMDRLRDVAAGEEKLVKARLKDESMEAREIDHAIKVTEERLRVLKEVVDRQKLKKEPLKNKLPVEPKEPAAEL